MNRATVSFSLTTAPASGSEQVNLSDLLIDDTGGYQAI
jgi:hypothetical protein